jgi:hypothetical protein
MLMFSHGHVMCIVCVQLMDKVDGGDPHAPEDLFAVHDFDIKIDLNVPTGNTQIC